MGLYNPAVFPVFFPVYAISCSIMQYVQCSMSSCCEDSVNTADTRDTVFNKDTVDTEILQIVKISVCEYVSMFWIIRRYRQHFRNFICIWIKQCKLLKYMF